MVDLTNRCRKRSSRTFTVGQIQPFLVDNSTICGASGEHAYLDNVEAIDTYLQWTWRNRRLPSPPQINLSVSPSVCPSIHFNYSAENSYV